MRHSVLLTATVLAAVAAGARPLAAQVGYPPDASPYRDLLQSHSLAPVVGWFGGSGGHLHLGPHGGWVYGVRYDLRAGQTLGFGFSVARADLKRQAVDPFIKVADRVSGPWPHHSTMADLAIQFNLTGAKTWRGIAPYTGVVLGASFGDTPVPNDTSGYHFGTKFYFGPQFGTRVFLTRKLHLRADVRAVFWKLSYPTQFAQEPPLDPGTPPQNSNAVLPPGTKLSEWTVSPWLEVGLGYMLRF